MKNEKIHHFNIHDYYFYCPHLKDRTDRYDLLMKEFQKIKIKDDKIRIQFRDREEYKEDHGFSTFGRYCATKAHFDIIKTTVQDNCEKCFIIEDDVIFKDGFVDNVTKLMNTIEEEKTPYEGVFFKRPRKRLKPNNFKNGYIIGKTRFVTAECYILTFETRTKIANNMEWFMNGRVIDIWYSKNINSIKSLEDFVRQNKTKSDVNNLRFK